MNKVQEYRDRLEVLRGEKKTLVEELRSKRSQKQGIDVEMSKLRVDIRREKGKKIEAAAGQADQVSAQQTE